MRCLWEEGEKLYESGIRRGDYLIYVCFPCLSLVKPKASSDGAVTRQGRHPHWLDCLGECTLCPLPCLSQHRTSVVLGIGTKPAWLFLPYPEDNGAVFVTSLTGGPSKSSKWLRPTSMLLAIHYQTSIDRPIPIIPQTSLQNNYTTTSEQKCSTRIMRNPKARDPASPSHQPQSGQHLQLPRADQAHHTLQVSLHQQLRVVAPGLLVSANQTSSRSRGTGSAR